MKYPIDIFVCFINHHLMIKNHFGAHRERKSCRLKLFLGEFWMDDISLVLNKIQKIEPIKSQKQEEWIGVHNDLAHFASISEETANDNSIVKTLVTFAAGFDDDICLGILEGFSEQGIGTKHSLWISSLALMYERMKNYIKSIFCFLNGLRIDAQPLGYLESKFKEFKKRMKDRMNTLKQFMLGNHNDIIYTFENGLISSTKKGKPIDPEIDIFEVIGYNINQPTPQSFSKSMKELPGYNPSLLLTKEGIERTFAEARLDFLGVDFVKQRIDKQKKPLNENTETFDPFLHEEPKPKSILKKKRTDSIQSPKAVQIESVFSSPSLPQKRKALAPIAKPVFSVGETLNINGMKLNIVKKLGDISYLCEDELNRFVIKPKSQIHFAPTFPQLFCLGEKSISDFYASKYEPYSFEQVIGILHSKRIDENIVLYFALQLLRMLKSLESSSYIHGNIEISQLLFRVSPEELPSFNDDAIWSQQGLSLSRCDKLTKNSSENDRKSVSNIIHILATKEPINTTIPPCPTRWNSQIWNEIFAILKSKESFDTIIETILHKLKEKGTSLRSSISRVNISLLESLS